MYSQFNYNILINKKSLKENLWLSFKLGEGTEVIAQWLEPMPIMHRTLGLIPTKQKIKKIS
jgi:hypothetical protein